MSALADDLLLLLLDVDTGRPLVDRTKFDYALGGAVLLQLALDGRIDASPGPARRARVTVLDAGGTGDDVCDDALHRIETRPARADKLVPALSKGLRARLLTRAEQQHLVRREEDRVLGLFRRVRWPAGDSRRRGQLVARLSDVLLRGATPDPRTSALVALLAAIDAAHVVVGVPDRSGRAAVRRRAREIGQGAWAADAVRKAVEAVQAAVAASTTGAVVAATVASS
jgi:Golgi phosphoprotein 3 (GPP34)